MDFESPQIVGIVGGSCAGKTWLADRLESILSPDAARLSLDDFYLDRSHLSPARRASLNFDHPRAIDWERLEQVLSNCGEGKAVAVPRYDFATHGRIKAESTLRPSKVIILEGLWLFRRPSIRRRLDLKIFIRSSNDLCRKRRIERDIRERGRTVEQVTQQLERYTVPMFERYVAPQERWADVVLESPFGDETVEELARGIRAKLLSFAVGI